MTMDIVAHIDTKVCEIFHKQVSLDVSFSTMVALASVDSAYRFNGLVLCRGWFDKWGGMVHAERGHESAGFPSMATQAWAMPHVIRLETRHWALACRAGIALWPTIKWFK